MTKYEQEIRDCVANGLFNDPWAIRQFLREVDAMHGTIEQLEREIVELKERKAWWIENAKALTAERNKLMNAGENHAEVAARMKQQIADLFSPPNT